MKSCNWGRKWGLAPSLSDSSPTILNSIFSISFPFPLSLSLSRPNTYFCFRLAFSFAAYWHCRISLMAFWLRASSHFAVCVCVCVVFGWCLFALSYISLGSMCVKCTSCSIERRSFISYWTIWPRMVSSLPFTSSNRAPTQISVWPTVFREKKLAI